MLVKNAIEGFQGDAGLMPPRGGLAALSDDEVTAAVMYMLETIGASSVRELFEDVPEACRYPEVKLPKALSEMEILSELYSIALKNSTTGCFASFIGAGAYNHFTPSVVPYLAGRGEFLTA